MPHPTYVSPPRRIIFTSFDNEVLVTAIDDHISVTATIPVRKLHLDGTTPEQVAAELALLLAFAISPDLLDVCTDSSTTIGVHHTFTATTGIDTATIRTAIRHQVH